MALLESKLNDYKMQELERRLNNLERTQRQRGRRRQRRQRRKSGHYEFNSERDSILEDRLNRGMRHTRSPRDPTPNNSTTQTPEPSMSQPHADSPDQEATPVAHSGPTTSSPVPRGPPVPILRVDEQGELESSDVTTSSEPPTSNSFLESTVIQNRSR